MTIDGAQIGVRGELASLFQQALKKAYPDSQEKVVLFECGQAKHGDYQCNNAMVRMVINVRSTHACLRMVACGGAQALFGRLKGKEGAPKAPRDVSAAVLAALPPNDVIAETSIAGPGEGHGRSQQRSMDPTSSAVNSAAGFINIKVSRGHVAKLISAMLVNGIQTWAPKLQSKRAVVDFSSPNVAKEMHVGHLRSTIIGDTICRTLEFCGVETVRLNHMCVVPLNASFGLLPAAGPLFES